MMGSVTIPGRLGIRLWPSGAGVLSACDLRAGGSGLASRFGIRLASRSRGFDSNGLAMDTKDEGLLARLFEKARTFTAWQERPVAGEIIEAAFALAQLGPTSANCQPLRLVLVKSPEAKARLLDC